MEEISIESNILNFKKEIELNSDKNNLYKIIFKAEDHSNLNIKAFGKKDLFINLFSNKFSIEKIKENKYFAMCDNLNEICDELESRINNKDISIKEKENNLIITISLPAIKVKEITFVLNSEEKNESEKINELTRIILELKNEINELKNTVSNQSKEINELKEITKHIPKIIELNESAILEGNEDYLFINSLFSHKCHFNLLYRATRDGSYPKDFHRKCDNKGPTLTIIKTNDNRKFGGYISKDRQYGDPNQVNVKDKNAFIFSIDKKKKFNIKDENTDAFSYSSIRGPNFTGSFGFHHNRDSGNMFNTANSYESETNPNYNSLNEYEFAGKNGFQAVEIEIFQVIHN